MVDDFIHMNEVRGQTIQTSIFFIAFSSIKPSRLDNNLHTYIWLSLVNLYIWLTISSCYGSIPLVLGLMSRDGGLSTLCHCCRFACQQRVLKTFPGLGYPRSEDEIVWLWHSLVNLYIYICIYIFIYICRCVYIHMYV